MTAKNYKITIKQNKKTGELTVFYFDEFRDLTGFAKSEGHFNCGIGFYLNNYKGTDYDSEEVKNLFNFYNSIDGLADGYLLKLVKKLTVNMNYNGGV